MLFPPFLSVVFFWRGYKKIVRPSSYYLFKIYVFSDTNPEREKELWPVPV